jgi:hypothetical protein
LHYIKSKKWNTSTLSPFLQGGGDKVEVKIESFDGSYFMLPVVIMKPFFNYAGLKSDTKTDSIIQGR